MVASLVVAALVVLAAVVIALVALALIPARPQQCNSARCGLRVCI
jgi:hypothetical protein